MYHGDGESDGVGGGHKVVEEDGQRLIGRRIVQQQRHEQHVMTRDERQHTARLSLLRHYTITITYIYKRRASGGEPATALCAALVKSSDGVDCQSTPPSYI